MLYCYTLSLLLLSVSLTIYFLMKIATCHQIDLSFILQDWSSLWELYFPPSWVLCNYSSPQMKQGVKSHLDTLAWAFSSKTIAYESWILHIHSLITGCTAVSFCLFYIQVWGVMAGGAPEWPGSSHTGRDQGSELPGGPCWSQLGKYLLCDLIKPVNTHRHWTPHYCSKQPRESIGSLGVALLHVVFIFSNQDLWNWIRRFKVKKCQSKTRILKVSGIF